MNGIELQPYLVSYLNEIYIKPETYQLKDVLEACLVYFFSKVTGSTENSINRQSHAFITLFTCGEKIFG